MRPHAYSPQDPGRPWYKTRCQHCNQGPGAPIHLYELPGITVKHVEPPPAVEEPEQDLNTTEANDLQQSLF